MKQCGQIIQVLNGTAKVKMQRHSSCAGCNACKMGSSDKPIELEALNRLNAREGDWVEVEMENQYVLTAAFMMYMIPLLFLVAGVLIGHYALGFAGVGQYHELLTAVIAFLATALAYIILNRSEKKRAFKEKMLPSIAGIIDNPEEFAPEKESENHN
ncbi:MAG: sigma E positive regulator RseC/MucC [Tindallia sp. MSAO_Bac2]|nr:MAG: sigma E positive regulator RseC/MucC [Tindallia sp. MSAO_Bac2]